MGSGGVGDQRREKSTAGPRGGRGVQPGRGNRKKRQDHKDWKKMGYARQEEKREKELGIYTLRESVQTRNGGFNRTDKKGPPYVLRKSTFNRYPGAQLCINLQTPAKDSSE